MAFLGGPSAGKVTKTANRLPARPTTYQVDPVLAGPLHRAGLRPVRPDPHRRAPHDKQPAGNSHPLHHRAGTSHPKSPPRKPAIPGQARGRPGSTTCASWMTPAGRQGSPAQVNYAAPPGGCPARGADFPGQLDLTQLPGTLTETGPTDDSTACSSTFGFTQRCPFRAATFSPPMLHRHTAHAPSRRPDHLDHHRKKALRRHQIQPAKVGPPAKDRRGPRRPRRHPTRPRHTPSSTSATPPSAVRGIHHQHRHRPRRAPLPRPPPPSTAQGPTTSWAGRGRPNAAAPPS